MRRCSRNWSEQYGVSLAVETAQANGRGYANRSYVAGRPTLTPRYYGGYGAGDYYYCRYGVGCGYGSLADYYRSFAIPGFPASFYGEYGGYSDGYYGRYVNRGYVTEGQRSHASTAAGETSAQQATRSSS